MELRRARAADIDALIALAAADPHRSEADGRAPLDGPADEAWWSRRLSERGVESPVVVAGRDGDGAPEGALVIAIDPAGPGEDRPTGHLVWLGVAPAARRQGHGRRLLVAAERMLAAAGCATATTNVSPQSPGSDGTEAHPAAFLAAMGWVRHDDRPDTWHRDVGDPDDSAHVMANRTAWDTDADRWVEAGRRAYRPERRRDPNWGCWGVPEADARMLGDVAGLDVVELGCGTGYVSAWCVEAGAARVVGLDNSPRQLETARVLQAEFDVPFPLIWADAERAPLADASFDVAISEYGAAIWCDPYRWIPEAARLLRPGGRLSFLGNSTLSMLCVNEFEADDGPATATMQRPQRGIHRFAWYDNLGIEFHISHGEMIRLLRSSGFEVVDLVELYIPPDADSPFMFLDPEWGAKWPAEEVWIARRTGDPPGGRTHSG
ncbi:MAG: GNAT family N-acetyltransferase [Actinomycetota bacterium]